MEYFIQKSSDCFWLYPYEIMIRGYLCGLGSLSEEEFLMKLPVLADHMVPLLSCLFFLLFISLSLSSAYTSPPPNFILQFSHFRIVGSSLNFLLLAFSCAECYFKHKNNSSYYLSIYFLGFLMQTYAFISISSFLNTAIQM